MSDAGIRFPDEVVARPERAFPAELVDAIDSPVGPDYTSNEAQQITDKIRAYTASTWRMLWIARKRKAHKALGYSTFSDYMAEEFDVSKGYGYRLLAHADLIFAIEEAAGIPVGERESPMGDFSERSLRDADREELVADVADAVADLDPDDTEGRAEAAAQVVEQHRATVTTTTTETVTVDTETGEIIDPVEPPATAAPAPGTTDGPAPAGVDAGPSDPSPTPDPAPAPPPSAGAGSPPKPKPARQSAMDDMVRSSALDALPGLTAFLAIDAEQVARAVARTDDRDEFIDAAAAMGRWARQFSKTLDSVPNLRSV